MGVYFFHTNLSVLLSFLTAFVLVFTSIPTIVKVAKAKNLIDKPDLRKSHSNNIATLGGIAIFSAILITFGVFTDALKQREFQYVYVASIILFFVGLKDDILIIAPLKKLTGQICASLIIIILGDLRFTSLHGFMGINHISYFYSIILTLFVFVVIINGFNLIDGIDGLASGVGIVTSLTFGTWFFLKSNYEYTIICATVAGSLVAFFWFNVFSRKNKIFMGDTGSLLIGLFMAVAAVQFNEMNIQRVDQWFIHAAPSVSFGILIIPLFDTLRVFIIRLIRRQSPFAADTNHVHHRLLAMGFSHLQSTMIILGINIGFIIMVMVLNNWGIIDLMILNLILATLISLLPEVIYKIKDKLHLYNNH
jgi:UDP-GlcNAc:undecaprenyl-phosphate/decaprenyl-phosphate GlcNAc-1-phosphate transferase